MACETYTIQSAFLHFLKRDISTKEVIVIYCIFNENLISLSDAQHVRQLKEDRDGNRYPMLKDRQAIIRVKDGLYFGEINNGEIIAITNDIDEAERRLKRADSNVEITVRYDGRNFNVESYKLTKLPRIFRVAYSEAGDHGLIIAIDDYFDGNYSNVQLFYDVDEVIKYIRRKGGKDGNFYVYGRQPSKDFHEQIGGIRALDVPESLRDTKHLKQAIEKRQKEERNVDV